MPAKVIHGHSIEIELGPSCPNPGIRRELEAQGKPYMCTSDLATWVGVDNKWYYVYRPGISTSIIPLLELTKDEDEMFDYLKDISECGNHELQEITGIHLANVSLVGEDYNIHYEPLYLNI